MKRLIFALILLTCTTSLAQDNVANVPMSVQRYVSPQSMAMGWVDLRNLDLKGFGEFVVRFRGEIHSIDRTKAIQDALVQLGVTRIYWVSELTEVTNGPKAFIVPVSGEKQEVVATIMRAFVSDTNGIASAVHDVVLVGQSEAVLQLQKDKKGPPNPELLAAAEKVHGSHGIVMLTPVQAVLPIAGMLPKFVNGDVERVTRAAEYLVNLRSISLSGELPPSKATLRIAAKSKETAAGLADLLNTWTMEQLAEGAQSLQLMVEGDEVVLTSGSVEQTVEILAAVQQLATGSSQPDTINSLKQIALSMHNFYDVHNHFPPQALVDGSGNRLLSWRVLILPWMDQAPLHNEFHLDEPWDSEHNLKLVARMPAVFKAGSLSGDPPEVGKTRFVAPLTKSSVFGRIGPGTQMREIMDGTSNSLMVVEVDADKAVIWTKPEDVEISEADPLSSIIGPDTKTFAACLCDGSARIFSREIMAFDESALVCFAPLHTPYIKLTNWPAVRFIGTVCDDLSPALTFRAWRRLKSGNCVENTRSSGNVKG